MSDILRLHLDIENSLQKDLDKTNKSMKHFNGLIDNAKEGFSKIGKSLEGIRNVASRIVPMVGGIFSAALIWDSVRGTLEMNKAMTQLSNRMGGTIGTADQLRGAVFGVTRELGISVENAEQLVSALGRLRVPAADMAELAKTAGMFSELSGVSAENSAELAGNLMRVGGMGRQAAQEMMAGMVQVQRIVGMTESEMSSLSDAIQNSSRNLRNMGRSAPQIQRFNKGVVSLAASFSSVGVNASLALDVIDKLLDPGQIEDNAFLLSQLGISMEEAFSGDLDPAKIASGFKDIGQNLRGMSGPAAAQMARQMGMSVHELRQLGDITDDQLQKVSEAMTGGASVTAALGGMYNEEATGLQKFERSMERIKGAIGEIALKIAPALEVIAENVAGWFEKGIGIFKNLPVLIGIGVVALILLARKFTDFFSKRLNSVATDSGKNFQNAYVEAMDQGTLKAQKMIKERVGSDIDLEVRTREGDQFKRLMAEADLWQARAETSLVGPVRNMALRMAESRRILAETAKPASLLNAITERNNKNIAGRLNYIENEKTSIIETLKVRSNDLEVQDRILKTREEFLRSQGLTKQNSVELARIEKQRAVFARDRGKLEEEMQQKELIYNKTIEKTRGRISNETLHNLMKEKESRESSLETIRKTQEELMYKSEMEMARIQQEIDSGQYNYLQQQELLVLQKQQEEIRKSAKSLIEQEEIANDKFIEQNKALIALAEERNITGKEGELPLQKQLGLMTKLRNAGGSAMKDLKQRGREAFTTLQNSTQVVGERLRSAVDPRNWAANLRKGVAGIAGGIRERAAGAVQNFKQNPAGAVGGAMKSLLGPLALIGGMLLRMEPVQQAIRSVMDALKAPLERLVARLMPTIQRIIEKLTPIFVSIVEALMPLVELLMPPLIWVLGAAVEIIGFLVGAVGNLLKFMMELPDLIGAQIAHPFNEQKREERMRQARERLQSNPIYGLAGALQDIGTELSTAGRDLRENAFNKDEMTSAVADGVTQAEITRTWTPAQLRAHAGGVDVEREMVETLRLTASGNEVENQILSENRQQTAILTSIAESEQKIAAASEVQADQTIRGSVLDAGETRRTPPASQSGTRNRGNIDTSDPANWF